MHHKTASTLLTCGRHHKHSLQVGSKSIFRYCYCMKQCPK